VKNSFSKVTFFLHISFSAFFLSSLDFSNAKTITHSLCAQKFQSSLHSFESFKIEEHLNVDAAKNRNVIFPNSKMTQQAEWWISLSAGLIVVIFAAFRNIILLFSLLKTCTR